MNKKMIATLLLFTLLIVSLFVGYYVLTYYRTTKEFTVTYENITSLTIYERGENGPEKTTNSIASGSTLRVSQLSGDYYIEYKADDGYADDTVTIGDYDNSIDIKPVFSTEKLASLYRDEKAAAIQAIKTKYPDLDELYEIKDDQLYRYGDWFGASLIYKGDSLFNKDNVGLVMQKKSGSWSVVTDPPMPTVNTYTHEDVPADVAAAVNKQLNAQ